MGYDGENLYLGIRERMPQKIGECAYCHDEVRTDEMAFACGSVLVHKECMLEYIVDTYDVDELAKALLFERVQHEG